MDEEVVTITVVLKKDSRMSWTEAIEMQHKAVQAIEDNLWSGTKITETNIN